MTVFSTEVIKLHVGGRIVIPKNFREKLGLKIGDNLLIQLYPEKLTIELLHRRLTK